MPAVFSFYIFLAYNLYNRRICVRLLTFFYEYCIMIRHTGIIN